MMLFSHEGKVCVVCRHLLPYSNFAKARRTYRSRCDGCYGNRKERDRAERLRWKSLKRRMDDLDTSDGITSNLTRKQAISVCQEPCWRCGGYAKSGLNGLDRVDNLLGYIPDNVLPCCGVCNMARGQSEIEDDVAHLRRIARHIERMTEVVVPLTGRVIPVPTHTERPEDDPGL